MQGAGQEHQLSHQPSHRRGINTSSDPDFPHPVSRCIRNCEIINFFFLIVASCFEVVAVDTYRRRPLFFFGSW